MISNLDKPFRGIHATYKANDCGGILDAANANFSSPNYPNNYPVNTDCHWIIKASEGDEIRLSFMDLRLESNCNKDYVMIRNGYHITSPLLGKFCGSTIPAPIVSSSSSLVVIFHSDQYGSAPGFSVTTTELQQGCGGLIHTMSGNISSPNYPSRYDNNVECVWIIEYVAGYVVKLEFTGRFDIEMDGSCEKDYILIEEFSNNAWQIQNKYCGSSNPETRISKSKKIRITFHSNDQITAEGFNIKYNAVCGGNFTDLHGGDIFSPNYPDFYENNLSCEYSIGEANQYVSLHFDDYFSIESHDECNFDYIKIYQNAELNNTQGPFCGSEAPVSRTLIGPVTVKFVTDTSYVAHGFRLHYEILDCGGAISLNSSSGVIGTPTLNLDFIQGIDCTWKINTQPNRVIGLRIIRMNIPVNFGCHHEYLEIRDGAESDPLIGKMCGTATSVVKSTGPQMMLKAYLRSPSARFLAFYYTTYGPNNGCGGTLRSSSGFIESLDVDNNGLYESYLDCTWLIVGDDVDKVIQITFERFDVESSENSSCNKDYLEFRENSPQGMLVGRYCGTTMPSSVITSSNKLNVLFHTDTYTEKSGFKFSFSAIDSPCGKSLLLSEALPKTLTSPNYPSPYPVNLHCRWRILINSSEYQLGYRVSRKVQVDFSDIDISCNGDYLHVQTLSSEYLMRHRRQGELKEASVRLCDSKTREIIASNGMEVVFHTDSLEETKRGFSLSYKEANCSRLYTASSGVIQNVGYPAYSNPEKGCNITITVEEGKTISLYFLQLQLFSRSSSNCENNFFKVFDGLNNSARLMASYCSDNQTIPDPFFSTTNSLYIETFSKAKMGLYYITYMSTDQGQGCGGSISAMEGVLSSPSYPQALKKNKECIWYLSVPSYHTMDITVSNFNLTSSSGCTTNYMEIYDGDSGDISERVARYCGSDSVASHTSSGSDVLIKLVTDVTNRGSGFFLTFKMNTYSLQTSRTVFQRHDLENDDPHDNIIYLN